MAQWGLAYASGPNYNRPWGFFTPEEKQTLLQQATTALASAQQSLAQTSFCPALPLADINFVDNDNNQSDIVAYTLTEIALLKALRCWWPADPCIMDYSPYDDAMATAMQLVALDFPNDLDVQALYCEALMRRSPWYLFPFLTIIFRSIFNFFTVF